VVAAVVVVLAVIAVGIAIAATAVAATAVAVAVVATATAVIAIVVATAMAVAVVVSVAVVIVRCIRPFVPGVVARPACHLFHAVTSRFTVRTATSSSAGVLAVVAEVAGNLFDMRRVPLLPKR
jgi:hypothetical protein